MKEYVDGMRQTIVADLLRLGVTDSVLLATAKGGDLDAVLVRLKELQPADTANTTLASDITDDDIVGEAADDVTDDVTDLDEPELRLARDTAYMIPLITAWQKQLGRNTEG